MSGPAFTALIAEDEPLLAQALRDELARAWPELQVVAVVGDGVSAVAEALRLQPDVLFFDIRMPGQGGLEAAAELADEWPQDTPFPALVFVTAYDQYAVQAFEAQAMDYLLKPVQPARLQKTVAKVQQALQALQGARAGNRGVQQPGNELGAQPDAGLDNTLEQLRHLLAAAMPPSGAAGSTSQGHPASARLLNVLQVSVGSSIRMVPVSDVVYFEAADKYVRVLTSSHEYLIRTPLKDLLPQLDTQDFRRIHRGTVVRADAIDVVHRDESGKLCLSLRSRPEKLAVSRLYSQQFRAM